MFLFLKTLAEWVGLSWLHQISLKILGKILMRSKEIKPKGPANASNEVSFDERDE